MPRGLWLLLLAAAIVHLAQSPLPMRLVAGLQPLAEVSAPPPDPVVHCVRAGSGEFVRRSACLAAGGSVHEPAWSDPR